MPTPYANRTEVAPEKTCFEIERTLKKHGATTFGSVKNADFARIKFELDHRLYQFTLTLPQRREYRTTAAHEQAVRSMWRALYLAIKAKLVAIDYGILTFEQEFLAYMLLPNNETVAEYLTPQLQGSKAMPLLLPPAQQEE